MKEHECTFVEEQESTGRKILPPCIECGATAYDAIQNLRNNRLIPGERYGFIKILSGTLGGFRLVGPDGNLHFYWLESDESLAEYDGWSRPTQKGDNSPEEHFRD